MRTARVHQTVWHCSSMRIVHCRWCCSRTMRKLLYTQRGCGLTLRLASDNNCTIHHRPNRPTLVLTEHEHYTFISCQHSVRSSIVSSVHRMEYGSANRASVRWSRFIHNNLRRRHEGRYYNRFIHLPSSIIYLSSVSHQAAFDVHQCYDVLLFFNLCFLLINGMCEIVCWSVLCVCAEDLSDSNFNGVWTGWLYLVS